MRSPLQRLYQTKLALLAIIFVIAGLLLLQLVHRSEQTGRLHWLQDVPAGEVGDALFAAGTVLVGIEFVDRSDSEQRENERVGRLLAEQAPAFRDAVIQGFAFNAGDLARVANPAVLDQIARNVLTLQLGDGDLADDAYADLRNQVIQAPER